MTETLFAFDKHNYHQCQQAFRGSNNQEYYLGDYLIEGGGEIDVRADKKAVGSCSIIRLRSRSRLFFRRSWRHIREDATDVTVLWFVKRGSLSVSHSGGESVARAGDFTVTRSMSPFTMECQPDEQSRHEVMHIIVPTHIFRSFFPHEIKPGFTVSAAGREFLIAERLLAEVFEDADELAEHIERLLLDSALSVLTDGMRGCADSTQQRRSLSEQRLQEILRYIEVHLSDPELSATGVAQACGISPRYLSHLLKQRGTSFSTLVRERRLEVAAEWLARTAAEDVSIAEVAFRVGFKSPAHFSRLFKQVYRSAPRAYRTAHRASEERVYLSDDSAPTLQ